MVFVVSSCTCTDSLSLYQYDIMYIYIYTHHTAHHIFLLKCLHIYIYIVLYLKIFYLHFHFFLVPRAWLQAKLGYHVAGTLLFVNSVAVERFHSGKSSKFPWQNRATQNGEPRGKVEVGKKNPLKNSKKRKIKRDVFLYLKARI